MEKYENLTRVHKPFMIFQCQLDLCLQIHDGDVERVKNYI